MKRVIGGYDYHFIRPNSLVKVIEIKNNYVWVEGQDKWENKEITQKIKATHLEDI
jgi:hypothetical protein